MQNKQIPTKNQVELVDNSKIGQISWLQIAHENQLTLCSTSLKT